MPRITCQSHQTQRSPRLASHSKRASACSRGACNVTKPLSPERCLGIPRVVRLDRELRAREEAHAASCLGNGATCLDACRSSRRHLCRKLRRTQPVASNARVGETPWHDSAFLIATASEPKRHDTANGRCERVNNGLRSKGETRRTGNTTRPPQESRANESKWGRGERR